MINNYIAEFFAVTNFGTRQSKGFGGFSLIANEEEPLDEKKIIDFLKENRYLFFYASELSASQDPMQVAKAIYTSMKTGVNMPNKGRVKGYLLYEYLRDNEIYDGTDKTLMVEEILPKETPHKKDRYLFVRALLGLADHYEFRFRNGKDKYTIKVKVECQDKDKDDKPAIERFPSPVTIKIVGRQVIFLFNEDLFREICGKKFVFSANGKTKEICVPDTFDVKQFIADYVEYHNLKDEDYAGDEYLPCHISDISDIPEFQNVYVKIEKGWDQSV